MNLYYVSTLCVIKTFSCEIYFYLYIIYFKYIIRNHITHEFEFKKHLSFFHERIQID